MLKLSHILKSYTTGNSSVQALRDVSINFRKNEFVSILGPSGCGKTTLLNIIGGLDRYDSGDLYINGRSTKQFCDADWDAYRNHSIGFVFQSYNLIPHQTVLANVELALTLSGVSKSERRRRAVEALTKVGLGDQLKKKPNQMSGGQMQRVAIARALVNDPDIVLADEPTGALDTQTSVQIMEILKEISKEKLIIMVTHNPDLADRYSSRIIRLLDGEIVDDSAPYEGTTETESAVPLDKRKKRKNEKTSMSFWTALSLSFQNLLTKKTRTFLTSFAGSIGIIGIALILSLSTGVQVYVNKVQEDTLASYPISLEAESIDISNLMLSLMADHTDTGEDAHPLDAVYPNSVMYDMMNTINNAEVNTNNLTAFRDYLEKELNPETSTTELYQYVRSVQYSYALDFNVYTKDPNGKIIRSDVEALMQSVMGDGSAESSGESSIFSSFAGVNVWQEMLPGENGELISDLLTDEEEGQYELIAGQWPKSAEEVVLIVDKNNELSDLILYALGLKPSDEMRELIIAAQNGEEIDTSTSESWTYDEILNMDFRLILPSDCYVKNSNGTYTDVSKTEEGLSYLYENGRQLRVVGILRPNEKAVSSMMTGAIGYTTALTDKILADVADSELIQAQIANPTTDAITGLPFRDEDAPELTDAEKAEAVRNYISTLSEAEKALLYTQIVSVPSDEVVEANVQQTLGALTREEMEQMILQAYAEQMGVDDADAISKYVADMDDETLYAYLAEEIRNQVVEQYAAQMTQQLSSLSTAQLAAMLDSASFTEADYARIYDNNLPDQYSTSTYEDNLELLGYVTPDQISTINLYASTFADKDRIKEAIEQYNANVAEEDQLSYTDYVALLMSSVTTIINAISYVLIAFVSISLVVSSIMIGIITYISVLERTKEIGILRAIGASKRDISRVFNAETIIVGCCSGLIGIGLTVLLCIPINVIVHAVTGIATINAVLPWAAALILVAISMVLTLIAGLIPSRIAAKKDPVIALRSE